MLNTCHHRNFLLHADRISAKRCRTEISRNHTADQIMKLHHKIVESIKKTFNAEHLVSLVQKEKSTYLVRKTIIRK